MITEKRFGTEDFVREMEERLFSNTVPANGPVLLSKYQEYKPDMKLVCGDYHDPVISRIIKISESAREKVNKYLVKKGLEPVGLPSYLEIREMPPVEKMLLLDRDGWYVLPVGNVGASYNLETDGITFYKAMVPGSRENEKLISIYKYGIRTANKLMEKHPKIRKPLQKLMRFYRAMIDSLQDPEKAEETLAHEYGHKVAEKIKDHYGRSLNEQLMEPALRNGEEEKAVAAVEGFNVNFTDEVMGRKTTDEETTYNWFARGVRRALEYLGLNSAADVLRMGYRGRGDAVTKKYLAMGMN